MNKSTHLLLLLIAPFVLNAQISTDKAVNAKKFREIAFIAGTPAIQLAYWDGKKIDNYVYGKKEAGKPDTINNETIFQAASLSKVVASYLYLILNEKGIFDLDKPLSEYYEYPRMSEDKNKDLITARHVLTHSTGLVNWDKTAGTPEWKKSKLVTRFTPGEKFMYSGEAMHYLQLVVEHLTKKDLDELCREYIFEPFGMVHSSFKWKEDLIKNIAVAHKDINTPFGYVHKFKEPNAAYTLYTTANDYMKFVIEGVVKGRGMDKKTHEAFLTANRSMLPKDDKSGGYNKKNICLGIMQQVNEEGTAYYHTGSNGGFRCMFMVYPKKQQAVTFFTNSNDGGNARKPILQYVFGNNQTFWSVM